MSENFFRVKHDIAGINRLTHDTRIANHTSACEKFLS